ncbi:MAG: histidine kinase N-terminal 7TM domain-containing protein, partial [Patescibacteria group bacterium]
MNIITILPLLSAIFVSFLGIFVFMKGKRERVNFTFALFAFVITVWLFCTFMLFLNKGNIDKAIFWDKFIYVGVVFVPVIMYHFGLALTKNKIIKGKSMLVVGYILSFFFLIVIPTKLFVNEIFIYQWGIHTKAQLFHHIFLLYFSVYFAVWFVMVYKYYKFSISSIEKERIKYSFLAFFALTAIGIWAYLPAYGISIYPFAYISGVIFVIILAYAIIRHRLMDIKMVLRKSSVFLASISLVIISAITVKYILIRYYFDVSYWADSIILLLAVLAFPIVKNYFNRLANKYFFSSLYDSREVIASLSDKLRSTLNVNKVFDYIYNVLAKAFHIKAFGVLSYDEKNDVFIVQYNKGFDINKRKKFLSNPELHK